MPTLPTIDVTQAQADRMLAVFGSPAAYKKWLRSKITEEVVRVERQVREEAFVLEQEQLQKEIKAALDPPETPA